MRELENVLEWVVVLDDDGPLLEQEVPEYIGTTQAPLGSRLTGWGPVELPADDVDLTGVMKALEGQLIEQALVRTQGNKTLAADLLRLNCTTLIECLRIKADSPSALHRRKGRLAVAGQTAMRRPAGRQCVIIRVFR